MVDDLERLPYTSLTHRWNLHQKKRSIYKYQVTGVDTNSCKMADHHWVQDLFPPKFTFEDHYELSLPVDQMRTRLDKLIDRVHRLDTEAIRDIYIRVLSMVTAQDREKQAASRLVDIAIQTDISTTHSSLLPKSDSSEEKSTSHSEQLSSEPLWTTLEFQLLKDHYLKEHENFLSMRGDIENLKRDNDTLHEKCSTLKKDANQAQDDLHRKDSHIERLKLVNQGLKTEIVRITNQLSDVESELKGIKSSYRDTLSENKLQTELINEYEVQSKITSNKMSRVHDEAALECDRKLAAMQIKHDTEVADLSDRINNLIESMDEEQRLHNRCKQGLDLLRLHYSQTGDVQNTK